MEVILSLAKKNKETETENEILKEKTKNKNKRKETCGTYGSNKYVIHLSVLLGITKGL